jgi:hypothetical protein
MNIHITTSGQQYNNSNKMVSPQSLRSASRMFSAAEKEVKQYEREYKKYESERVKIENRLKKMQDRTLSSCARMFQKAERTNNKKECAKIKKLRQRVIIEKTIYKQYLHSLYISKFLEYSICEPDKESDENSVELTLDMAYGDSDEAYGDSDDESFETPPGSPTYNPISRHVEIVYETPPKNHEVQESSKEIVYETPLCEETHVSIPSAPRKKAPTVVSNYNLRVRR